MKQKAGKTSKALQIGKTQFKMELSNWRKTKDTFLKNDSQYPDYQDKE